MRKQVLWLALCAGLGLSACATGRPQAPVAPLDTSKACASWRWIGISRPEARCPDIPGWSVKPLFPQLAPVRRSSGEYCAEEGSERKGSEKTPEPELIRELNRFCVYEIDDRKRGSNKKLPFPPAASPDLVRLDRDCAAVSLGERYLDAKSWKTGPDPERLLALAGKPRTPLPIDGERGVRLAFLDTEPTLPDVPMKQGRSPHGFTLAKIAQELVCTPEPDEQEPYKRCAAQITTQLALPILEFNAEDPNDNVTDRERGGFFGMQSDLAVAIREEVDSWLKQRTERSQRHLVLNLSLAWDGQIFGGLNGEQIEHLNAGTQAVYRALEYAAGFDVLVLAAAGNQKHEPCVNFGPLLPAAWEKRPPQQESCGKPDDARPLVYAVGGVQEDGSPLANARPGGMPRRAAYGKTRVFEGSSVATAIVSSIAAVVWDARPELESHEVMAILDSASGPGVELARKADFWFAPSTPNGMLRAEAPPVRRLSLCSVLGQPCPQEALAVSFVGNQPGILEVSTKGSCQPWLFPQPDIMPCPACDPPKN